MTGLEALKRIRQETCPATYMADFDKNECCDIIEKSLKALEIIKNKDVDIYILTKCKTVDEYNSKIVHIVGETRELTQEDFDIVREVLE